MIQKRTDLAAEAKELWKESAGETTKLEGVEAEEKDDSGYHITTVRILNETGAEALSKPVGKYVTVDVLPLTRREDDAFRLGAEVLARQIREMLPLEPESSVLVAGLGNEGITPDAIGPLAVRSTIATRHLIRSMPESFGNLRSVSAVQTGVLGTTGVESAELVAAIAEDIRPDAVIAVDALASASLSRLCRTVQIADTGIIPGSGVGNGRSGLSRKTLGMPVLAIGVPTVVDAATMAQELCEKSGKNADLSPEVADGAKNMIVTPKDIDKTAAEIAKLVGYAVNLALQPSLSIGDVDMFLN